jgi:hypothetical protein
MAGWFPRAESARSLAIVALVVGAVGLGTAIYSLTAGVIGAAANKGGIGVPGPPGANGSQGPPGHNGTNGTNGTTETWAQFSPTFVDVGGTNNIALAAQPCGATGHGVYVCNVTFNNTGFNNTEFASLNFTPTSSFLFTGSNPSLDWLLTSGHSYTFQLWFQVVQSTGVVNAVITLHLAKLNVSG